MVFYWNLSTVALAIGSCALLYSHGWRRIGFWAMVAVFTAWMQWGMYTNYPLPGEDGFWVALAAALVAFVCGIRRGGRDA